MSDKAPSLADLSVPDRITLIASRSTVLSPASAACTQQLPPKAATQTVDSGIMPDKNDPGFIATETVQVRLVNVTLAVCNMQVSMRRCSCACDLSVATLIYRFEYSVTATYVHDFGTLHHPFLSGS